METVHIEGAAGPHQAVLMSRAGPRRFAGLVDVVSADSPDEVMPCLRRIEDAVQGGLHAAGFLAYEAAPAFDAAFVTQETDGLPLLWFGLYEEGEASGAWCENPGSYRVGPWRPLVAKEAYEASIEQIRSLIAAGDTYQVNYTFPLAAPFSGDPRSWFRVLCESQGTDYGALIDTGRYVILSASPELFFRLDGDRLTTRPMKGTHRRGRWPGEDRAFREALAASEKDRAENVMIVDLLRSDMGRVSVPGTVCVESLFDTERYETLWQMTSSISSRVTGSVPEIMQALFPSGSVTGAPKVRTMQIIRALEPFPRGVYCGTVGWWSPGGQAEFNVAIRTVSIDRQEGEARYGVGGGITWSSTAEGEYEECAVKAAILKPSPRDFELLESFLVDEDFFLLEEHLARLAASAEYFGFDVDLGEVRRALSAHLSGDRTPPEKLRLLVARDGGIRIESEPASPMKPLRVGLARGPVDEGDVFLFHKTTHRSRYEEAKASRPDCDDVLLYNGRGELTESTRANVLVQLDGEWLTPPVSCGLLAGTMRAHLLSEGRIREAVLPVEVLERAQSIRLINSVRKWIDVEFVE